MDAEVLTDKQWFMQLLRALHAGATYTGEQGNPTMARMVSCGLLSPFDVEEAMSCIKNKYVDYLCGIDVKLALDDPAVLDGRRYDRAHGEGLFKKILHTLPPPPSQTAATPSMLSALNVETWTLDEIRKELNPLTKFAYINEVADSKRQPVGQTLRAPIAERTVMKLLTAKNTDALQPSINRGEDWMDLLMPADEKFLTFVSNAERRLIELVTLNSQSLFGVPMDTAAVSKALVPCIRGKIPGESPTFRVQFGSKTIVYVGSEESKTYKQGSAQNLKSGLDAVCIVSILGIWAHSFFGMRRWGIDVHASKILVFKDSDAERQADEMAAMAAVVDRALDEKEPMHPRHIAVIQSQMM